MEEANKEAGLATFTELTSEIVDEVRHPEAFENQEETAAIEAAEEEAALEAAEDALDSVFVEDAADEAADEVALEEDDPPQATNETAIPATNATLTNFFMFFLLFL